MTFNVHVGIARPGQGHLRKLSNHFPLIFSLLIESLWQWMLPSLIHPLEIHELLTLQQHGST